MSPSTTTFRFMTLWVLYTAPVSLGWGFAMAFLVSQALAARRYDLLMLTYPLGVAASLVSGALESRLISRHRARVRFWTLAAFLGSLLSAILSYFVFDRLSRGATGAGSTRTLLMWIAPLIWGGTYGLCSGACRGLALWGRRWTSAWPLWLAGFLILHAAPSLLLQLVHAALRLEADTSTLHYVLNAILHGAIPAAGTAWLLDRLVFRADPEDGVTDPR